MRNAFLKALGVAGVAMGMCAYVASAQPAGKTLIPLDVGFVSVPGSTTVGAGGVITVVGGGSDIWNNSDNFHYAYFKQTGDFDYVMKVESLVGNSGDGGWSKVELMARHEDPAAPGVGPQGGDEHISNMTTRKSSDTANGAPAGVNYRGPQWRPVRDGASTWTAPNPGYPPNMPDNWMRLERVGSVFWMYTSNDGTTWNQYNPFDPQGWDTAGSWPPGVDGAPNSAFVGPAWGPDCFVGIAVTSHNDAADPATVAVVSNFKAWTPVPIAITTQPPATINAAANSTLSIPVVAAGDPVHYEWRKDGVPLTTNQLGATYRKPLCQVSDSGSYTVRCYGAGQTEVISTPCVVTITVDVIPPTMTEVKPLASQTSVGITFSEPVTSATATVPTNYQLSGGVTVTAAALSTDGYRVILTTSPQAFNTQYTLTVNNVKDTAGNTIVENTATFTSVSLLSGYAFYERWDDASGDMGDINAFAAAIADGSARAPDVTSLVNQFGGPWGATDNYNARVRTFFTPPSNGNYVFFVSADDNARVYLSTDDKPANKKLICQESGWSNQYQWTAPGAGSAEDKRSDAFINIEWPDFNTITLKGGTNYFMEVLWNEGGGGDGADVTFKKDTEADPVNSTDGMFMRGTVISWYETVDVLPPIILTQPVDSLTIPAGGTGTLSVVATNPGAAALTYQWQKNGRDIPGATSADYVIANAKPTDIGQYWVKVSNPKASVTTGQNDTPTVVLVTATGVFNIEAEDFDTSGAPKAAASTMPYTGGAYGANSALWGIDYNNTDLYTDSSTGTPAHGIYRYSETGGSDLESGDPNPRRGVNIADNLGGQWGRTRAGEWDMTANYKIGWVATGDWGNYTRTFPTPAKSYYVFAAGSYDGVAASQLNGAMGFVTAGVGTTNQTVEAVGTFDAPGTGAWSRNNLVAMTDAAGAVKTVEIGGPKTIRWTYNSGDADYLLFIPAGAVTGPQFSAPTITGGNLNLSWTGTGTLQEATVVTGPWIDSASQANPQQVPAATGTKYFRIRP